MQNIYEILARAAALRDETQLNSISPERAGGIMYDTLLALNDLWLQQGAALVINKIYASVAAMEADTAPVSDLTGQPLRPGQIVVIASSDSDNGSVYRYNGTDSPSWSLVGEIGNLEPVDSLDSDSTQLPLAAHQGKVLDEKISQLGQKITDNKIAIDSIIGGNIFPEFNESVWEQGSIDAEGADTPANNRIRTKGYLRIKQGCIINKTNISGYTFGVCFYDSNKEYLGHTTHNDKSNYDTGSASYIRLVFRKTNDGAISVSTAVGHECSLIVNYISTSSEIDARIEQTLGTQIDKIISQKGTTEALNNIDGSLLNIFTNREWNVGSYYDVINTSATNRKYCVVSCKNGDYLHIIIPTTSWFLYLYFADSEGVINWRVVKSSTDILIENNNGRTPNELRITAVPNPDRIITPEIWDTFDIECYIDGKIQEIQKELSASSISIPISISPIWNLGYIKNNGDIVVSQSGDYYYSNAINVNAGDVISISTDGQGFTPICLYIGSDLRAAFVIDKITVGVNSGVKTYQLASPFDCTLVLCRKGDASIEIISNKVYNSKICKNANVNVAAWNFGLLNNGVTPMGIPNAELNTILPNVKRLLVSLGMDILFATEIPLWVDRDASIHIYEGLLKQFFPYRYMCFVADTTPSGLFSKYPLQVSTFTSTGGRNFILGYAIIQGEKVGVGVIHNLPGSSDGAARIIDEQQVIDYFDDYDKVIVAGDFNTYSDEELDVFRNAGWVLGNCGYFGNIDTYQPSQREWYIDNIVTKGINIDSFEKADNRADVSDHYPVFSKVSFLIP